MTDVRDAFFNEITKIALNDNNVVFLTADMGALALENYKANMPSHFINVGIAEQNLISVATGMALAGKRVFAYAIASFIVYRCYDQIRCNIAGMNLPVTLIGAGPGLAYGSDGPSHYATTDVQLMGVFPNMTILTPHNADESMRAAQISYKSKTPVYVRISKGTMPARYGKYTDPNYNIPFMVKGEACELD